MIRYSRETSAQLRLEAVTARRFARQDEALKKKLLEVSIKAAVKLRLKELGAYQHWPVQNGMGAPCLDCHGCFDGLYFGIETKAPGKLPTARQQATIRQIRDAGGLTFVIDSLEQARALFHDRIKTDRADPDPLQREAEGPAV
jgi:hypothetical protein